MIQFNIFKKNDPDVSVAKAPVHNSMRVIKNWYEERHDTLIVHRNISFVISLILIITLIASIATIAIIVNAREFDPFVIQIDDTTGAAKIVNPTSSEALDANESLAQYFIKKYVTARETYNPVDFDTSARQTIRLLSTSTIFWNYTSYIKNKDVDPTIIYGQKNTTYLTIKSWSKLDKYKYMVRFAIQETTNDKKTFNKLAVIDFGYVPMNLTELERDINPIGFQVKGYRVDDDNS